VLFLANTLSSQNNNSNSVSYVFFAQIIFLDIYKNVFIFQDISNKALEIDIYNKDSCRDNKVKALILLQIVELEYIKDYYKIAS